VDGHPKGDESALGIFARDASTGAVKQLSGRACVERQDPPRDLGCTTARNLLGLRFVTVSPDDRFLYTTGSSGITIFRRNLKAGTVTALPGKDGCLSTTTVGCTQLPGPGGVEDLAITRDGTQAYASGNGYVLAFARDPRAGILSLRSCFGEHGEGIPQPGCALARGIVSSRSVNLSPDERFVYVASLEDALAIFARNLRTGQLTQLTGVDGCINGNGKDGCDQQRTLRLPGGEARRRLPALLARPVPPRPCPGDVDAVAGQSRLHQRRWPRRVRYGTRHSGRARRDPRHE
jgi:hypothetical protein